MVSWYQSHSTSRTRKGGPSYLRPTDNPRFDSTSYIAPVAFAIKPDIPFHYSRHLLSGFFWVGPQYPCPLAIVRPADCSHPVVTKPKDAYCYIGAPLYLWKMRTFNAVKGVGTEIMMRLAKCTTNIAGYNDTACTQ